MGSLVQELGGCTLSLLPPPETVGDQLQIYCITLDRGENRFDPASCHILNRLLDAMQDHIKASPPSHRAALIFTGTGKYFSLGLDLGAYLAPDALQPRLHSTYLALLARIMQLGIITVAAINGHAIAGGMVFALACDYRVMRTDRGYIAMNEIELPSSIPAGMVAVVKSRLGGAAGMNTIRDCMLGAVKYTAREAVRLGFVDEATEMGGEEPVMLTAVALASKWAHPISKIIFLKVIKQSINRQVLDALLFPEDLDHFVLAKSVLGPSKI